MASSTILTFPSNLSPVVPTFVGNGAKIEVPDLQVVFWGPYWPGTGQLSVGGIMQAVNTIVSGPFLDGMKQYGYTGPVKVRQPIVNTGNPNFTLPAPGPNVDQSTATAKAVVTLVDTLVKSNAMGDVSSNHDLMVMVFVDPSFAYPNVYDAAGKYLSTTNGAHSAYIYTRPLQPDIRFGFAWIGTQPFSGLSAFDRTTMTFGHELVEWMSNPFLGTGWVQTSPQAGASAGEIGDVCNNTACVVDGIAVEPYWGVQQGACILPTETRTLSLNQALTKHVPKDGPVQYALVDLGPLCGKGNFDYVERTWDNVVAVSAAHPGYQAPAFTWSINGTVVKAGNSIVSVPAHWDSPTAPVSPSWVGDSPRGSAREASLVAAGAGVGPHVPMTAMPMSSLGGVAPMSHLDPRAGSPANALTEVGNQPPRDMFDKSLAALRVTAFESVLTIECGPGVGNVSFNLGCQAVEHWDNIAGTKVTTSQSTSATVTMTNQEIIWGASLQKATNDCYAKTHKVTGGGNPVRPQNPGDPGPQGGGRQVEQIQQINQAGHMNKLK